MTSRSFSLEMPDDGRKIAGLAETGAGPSLVWLGGFRSDMTGSKAEALAAHGRATGRPVVRFDYSGHGISDGPFSAGRISRWAAEARAVIDAEAPGDKILIGSSMGGWISLLLAHRGLPGLKGLVLIAPAPDFTERLMLPSLSGAMRHTLAETGEITLPDDYGSDPTRLSQAFFDDARSCLLLDAPLRLGVPVHILQGTDDRSVPPAHAHLLVSRLAEDDVTLTLVKGGDHRLSRPDDLTLMLASIDRMVQSAES
ncbi:alpha/beta hydrolase [Oryzibacter oryziterrae]|uniref:alpha/beta hydrolase n=1 Tax=Oryzibacter oryziterrae TaxID=2766474 RepID=UPI001F3A2D7D|nr:alpha/beta hydrolase [Oryzibacter oryziterrae]